MLSFLSLLSVPSSALRPDLEGDVPDSPTLQQGSGAADDTQGVAEFLNYTRVGLRNLESLRLGKDLQRIQPLKLEFTSVS